MVISPNLLVAFPKEIANRKGDELSFITDQLFVVESRGQKSIGGAPEVFGVQHRERAQFLLSGMVMGYDGLTFVDASRKLRGILIGGGL